MQLVFHQLLECHHLLRREELGKGQRLQQLGSAVAVGIQIAVQKGRITPASASSRPIRSIIVPPIMLRIAMIVTPVGRDFGGVCTNSRVLFC